MWWRMAPGFPNYNSGPTDHRCGGVLLRPFTGPIANNPLPPGVTPLYQFVLTSKGCATQYDKALAVVGGRSNVYQYPTQGNTVPLWPNSGDPNRSFLPMRCAARPLGARPPAPPLPAPADLPHSSSAAQPPFYLLAATPQVHLHADSPPE